MKITMRINQKKYSMGLHRDYISVSDFFKYQTAQKKTSEPADLIEDHFLLKSEHPELFILSDKFLSKEHIGILRKLLRKYAGIEEVSILYTYDIRTKDKDLEKNITKYVMAHAIDFSKFIPPKSKILTLGRALYSITKDTSIQLSAFYDIVWNDTKFYDPGTKSWIFPSAWLFGLYDFTEGRLIDTYDLYYFKHQLKEIVKFNPPSIRIPELRTQIIDDPNQFLEDHWDEVEVAWDLETSGLDCTRDEIRCITMSFDGRTGYYLRWKDIDKDLLNTFLENKFQIGANLKFDCRFLWYRGITNAMPDFDTLHAGHALNEMRSNSLKTHAWVYTYYGGYDLPLEEYKKKFPKTKKYTLIPESILSDYAAKDAIITYQVWKEQLKHLAKDPDLEKYFFEHMMPTVRMFVEIEAQGVFINWENVRSSKKTLLEKRNEIEKRIFEEVGHEFNVASSKELSHILEFEMNLPFLGTRNKEGGYFTNEEHLTEWKKKGYKIAELLLEYRGYSALLNTFVGDEKLKTAYWEYKAPDEKMYPSYSVMMANSHRNKANSPNMQQVPHHGDKAWIVRAFFDVPSDEYKISEFDYSGLQLRIGAILSGDENMRRVFTELGGDLHSMTAQPVFAPEIPLEEFISRKKEEQFDFWRRSGKFLNFGLEFGAGAYTITNTGVRKDWTKEQCLEFIDKHELEPVIDFNGKPDYHLTVGAFMRKTFFQTYPGLVDWHNSMHEFALKYGYVRSIHGARRLLPQLLHVGNDKKMEANLKNISLNSPVQNFEIVVISRAMRNFHNFIKENNLKSRLWATVHDAVEFYIHKDEEELMKEKIPEILEEMYPEYGGLPLTVEGDISDPRANEPSYWGYGKDWYG